MKIEENTELRTERTVLVVDDEKTLRFTVAEAMRDEGYHTHEAASGADAFGLLREENIDVVLLDLKLKESGEGRFSRVLHRSGSNGSESEEES